MTLPSASELERRAADLMARWRVVDTRVRVRWNRRLSTTAGRAFVQNGRIELNPTLLQRAPEELSAVLAHETAHVAACRLFGPNVPAHGRHWRSLMRLAGFPPDVTHDIPVRDLRRGRGRGRFLYLRVCDACGDRRIVESVRYGRCHGCSARDRFLLLRAPASTRGRKALEELSLSEVRAQCIMGDP